MDENALDVDAELATNEEPHIFHNAQMEETEEDDETGVTAIETVIPTVTEAHRAAQTFLRFAENQENRAQMLPHVNHKADRLKQADTSDFGKN